MTGAQVVVTLLGLAAVAWVNWYFFLAGSGAAAVATSDGSGPQRVRVEVKGGYSPAVVRVRAGRPVRLEFHRDETSSCTEEVVLPDFGIRTYLPAHRTTPVSFTPAEGTYEFTCGMGMVRGKIVAEKA
jgi:plastocyanin domain-containing protein